MVGALFFSHEGIFFVHKSVTRLNKKDSVISEQDDRSRYNLIFTFFFLSYFVESDSESNPPDDEGEENSVNLADGVWMNIMGIDAGPQALPFIAVAGPKHAPPPQSQPLAYVQLFITDNLIDKMVTEINTYAQQWITRNRDTKAQWFTTGSIQGTQLGRKCMPLSLS